MLIGKEFIERIARRILELINPERTQV